MRNLTRALLTPPVEGRELRAVPCRIVTATPLVIDLFSAATYSASKVTGLTYTIGATGLAVFAGSSSKPFVLPLT